jgi:hypothetical protein
MKHLRWVLVAVLSLWTAPAWAQATATTGQIEGTITDESKGALPGVTVAVRNVQTGFMREGVSDETGLYRLSLLPLGTYELTANLQGFGPIKQAGLLLRVNETLTVPIVMKISGVQESIEVVAATPIVEIARTLSANTLNSTLIETLPMSSVPGFRPAHTGRRV